jgi:hypothetical protein
MVVRVKHFIWLDEVEDKIIWKHGVEPHEAEEVFFNRPRFKFIEKGYRPGEDVYAASGQTEAGRYLVVFFILKPKQEALIISARDMTRRERRSYDKK